MDPSLRNSPALIRRIEILRDELIKRFEALISYAVTDKTDRNTTALAQYSMQYETDALIRCAENLLSLIRQLQEAWLFGQLNTIDGPTQQQANDDTKAVTELLQQLIARQSGELRNGDAMLMEEENDVTTNGD
ncbi:Hypothetical protein R9X50_00599700 [Acrodontium crateriforme]|uniref:Mediator complex subunit 22 n=1 Tax=Acrodontium crateriforme TaxID=150365 RepID=A0AAQ3MD03_9PEZI|nr:Hypothetical protein R9X50_00599700 [Acrodontium crateriforme]